MKQIKITKKIINSTKLLHDKELELEQIFQKNFSKECWIKYFKDFFLKLGLEEKKYISKEINGNKNYINSKYDDRFIYQDDKIKYEIDIFPFNLYQEYGIEFYAETKKTENFKTVEFKKSEIIEAAKFINDFIRIAEIVSKMKDFSNK
jgi:hypothetical protein